MARLVYFNNKWFVVSYVIKAMVHPEILSLESCF